jgi:hypothetical protein
MFAVNVVSRLDAPVAHPSRKSSLDVGASPRLFLSHHLDAGGSLTGNRGGLVASRPFGHAKKHSEDRGEGNCHPNHV